MKLAFSTLGCPEWSFAQVVETAHALGYPGVELRFLDGSLDMLKAEALSSRTREWTQQFLRELKVEICCLDSSVKFDSPRAAARATQKQLGFEFIDRAAAMGIPLVRVFGDQVPEAADAPRVLDWVADGLRSLGNYAADKGVTVLLETHGDFIDTARVRTVMEKVDLPSVGVLWDTHHPWRLYGEAPSITVERLGPWIKHTHWKDSVAAEGEAWRYVPFGEGEFPAAETLAALRSIDYDGWLCLEWEKKWHPEIAEPEQVLPGFAPRMNELLTASA